MFNKYSIKGKYSKIHIYKTNVDNIEEFEEKESDNIFKSNFIYLKDLSINVNENEIKELELSGDKSFKNKKEQKEDKNPKYYEDDIFVNLLNKDGIYLVDIDNYDYSSPNFKTLFSNFELGLLLFKLIPFEYITEGLIEGYLIEEIHYDNKNIDLEKNGFIFKDYMSLNNKENIKILIEIKKKSVYILEHTLD